MRIHILQFDEKVTLGTYSGWLAEQECEIVTWRCDLQQWPSTDSTGPMILLGGYMGVGDRDRLSYLQKTADWLRTQVHNGRPMLAICLGSQLLAHSLGAQVHSKFQQERGIRRITLTEAGQRDPLFSGLPDPFISFEWHNDSFELPTDCLHLAKTEICSGQAFRFRNAWGVQFHPEVDEPIVADWCRRTGAGEEPLQQFRKERQVYSKHARQLLKNYLNIAIQLS